MDEVKGNGNVCQTSLPQQPGFSHKCLAGSGPFCKRRTRPVRLPAVGPWVILSQDTYEFFLKLWGSEKKDALHNKLVTSGWDRTNDLAVNGRTLCRLSYQSWCPAAQNSTDRKARCTSWDGPWTHPCVILFILLPIDRAADNSPPLGFAREEGSSMDAICPCPSADNKQVYYCHTKTKVTL